MISFMGTSPGRGNHIAVPVTHRERFRATKPERYPASHVLQSWQHRQFSCRVLTSTINHFKIYHLERSIETSRARFAKPWMQTTAAPVIATTHALADSWRRQTATVRLARGGI